MSENIKNNLEEKLVDDLYNYYKPIESKNEFYGLLKTYLFPRIQSFLSNYQSYIFEENYVESQWKEMASIHYINTSYNIKKTVARIHFFDCTKKTADTYLGYITLRPFSEYDSILSTVVPNIKKLSKKISSDSDISILTHKQSIHINKLNLEIDTFWFFAQDGVVTRCAHADVLMLTNYLNCVYGYNKIPISKMNLKHLYSFPNDGLDEFEILKLLDENDIPAKIYSLEENNILNPKDLIKVYVESGLPVIIGYENHVVLIIGIKYLNGEDFSFVLYDDSGSFSQSEGDMKYGNFISVHTWDDIRVKKDKCIIIPVHGRLYMQYPVVRTLLNRYLNVLIYGNDNEDENNDVFTKIPGIQTILVETGYLKNFFEKYKKNLQVKDNNKTAYKNFKKDTQLHYVWVTWFNLDNDNKMVVLTDPTLNENSIHLFMPYILFNKEVPFEELKLYLQKGGGQEVDQEKK